MNIPVEDWSNKLREEVKKSQSLITHYEMLCEQHKVCDISFDQTIFALILAP